MATIYTPRRVTDRALITHDLPPKRSGAVEWGNLGLAGKGAVRIVEVKKSTGLWIIAQEHCDGSNAQVKEYVRVIRQANPTWTGWKGQIVPKGTPLVLPPKGKQFQKVPGAGKIIVDQGDSLWRIIERHYKNNRGLTLPPQKIANLVSTVAIINGIADVDHEIEKGWEIYVPDEAVDNACGTCLCTSEVHETDLEDTLGESEIKIQIHPTTGDTRPARHELSKTDKEILGSVVSAQISGDLKLMSDLLRDNSVKVNQVRNAAGEVTHITIRGTNRDLAKKLGFKGTRYRVGSKAYESAMKSYAEETGQMISRTGKMSTIMSSMKGVAKGAGIGAAVAVAIDAGTYIVNGEADKIMTREFAVEAGNDVANSLIASGAGAAASALTVAAMSAAGASVVPGIGTAVGFLVGLGVGLALSHLDVKWIQ